MNAIECPYRIKQNWGTKRPVLKIRVRNRNRRRVIRSQRIWALVDSGADFCVFPRWLADDLGLYWSAGERRPVTTAGGTAEAYEHIIHIELYDYPRHEFTTPARFLAHDMELGLLGQRGFFENFHVTLDQSAEKFWLLPRF